MSDVKHAIMTDATGQAIIAALQSTDVAQQRIQEINSAAESTKTAAVNAIDQKGRETLSSIPDDYSALSDEVSQLSESMTKKIDKPKTADNNKFPRAKNGEVEWVEQGLPTDAQTEKAVQDWLNDHPEATTTVQDGSIIEAKLAPPLRGSLERGYVNIKSVWRDTETDLGVVINRAISDGITSIYIPSGRYRQNTAIDARNVASLQIVGDFDTSWKGTVYIEAACDFIVFDPHQQTSVTVSGLYVRSTSQQYDFLHECTLIGSTIRDCKLYGFNALVHGAFSTTSVLDHVQAFNMRRVILCSDIANTKYAATVTDSSITNCYFNMDRTCGAIVFDTTTFTNMTVIDCYIDYFKFLLSSPTKRDGVSNSVQGHRANNVFNACKLQYFWRIFELSGIIQDAPTVFDACMFFDSNKNGLNSEGFIPDEEIAPGGVWTPCGLLINQNKASGNSFHNVGIYNSIIDRVEQYINIEGDVTNIRESGNYVWDGVAPYVYRNYLTRSGDVTVSKGMLLASMDYAEVAALPKPDSVNWRDVAYESQHVWLGDTLYIFHNRDWIAVI